MSPPGDPSGVVDRVLRKAARRHARHGAGIVLLALTVIAGSIGGFYALSRVFGGTPPANVAAPVVSNGLIVFSDIRISGYDDEGVNVVDDWHLYTVDPADGRVTRIGPDSVEEALYPTWSPDGSRIAFVGFVDVAGESPRGSIYVADADGTNAKAVFTTAEVQQIEGLRWSPDGSRIGYELADFGSYGSSVSDWSWTIWTMAPDGTDRKQVTATGREMHFSWSPDGMRIVFERFEPIQDESQRGEAGTDLFIIDADGGREEQVTHDGMSRDPAWSPDGMQIAFSHGPRGGQHIALIGVDRSGLREMAGRAEAGTFFPYGNTIVWSPDGEQIAFAGHSLDDVCFISILVIDEGTVRTLVSSPAEESCPGQEGMSWAPAVESEVDETDEVPTPSSEPTPSPEESPAPQAVTDLGLGFPVCNVTSATGEFAVPTVQGVVYVATRVSDTSGCPPGVEGPFQVVALDLNGDQQAEASFGPIDCFFGCSAFAAPDIDGDGADEIAVSVGMADGVGVILFKVEVSDAGTKIEPIEIAPPGDPELGLEPGRALFQVGGGIYPTGAYCLEPEDGSRRLFFIWRTSMLQGDANNGWEVRSAAFMLRGNELVLESSEVHRVPEDEPDLPANAQSELCGASVV